MLVSFARHIYILVQSDHEKKSAKWPKCHNLVSYRTQRTPCLFFGQTLVHNCWSSTNNTSLMSEEIKISMYNINDI